jgi:hypothetical protein
LPARACTSTQTPDSSAHPIAGVGSAPSPNRWSATNQASCPASEMSSPARSAVPSNVPGSNAVTSPAYRPFSPPVASKVKSPAVTNWRVASVPRTVAT